MQVLKSNFSLPVTSDLIITLINNTWEEIMRYNLWDIPRKHF